MVLKIGSIRLSISHDSDPIRLIRSKSDQTKVPTSKPTVRSTNQTNHLVQFFYFLFSRHLRGCSHCCRPLERRHVGSTPTAPPGIGNRPPNELETTPYQHLSPQKGVGNQPPVVGHSIVPPATHTPPSPSHAAQSLAIAKFYHPPPLFSQKSKHSVFEPCLPSIFVF